MKQPQNKSFLLVSQTGCLLPMLMILNLFFGWIFFKPLIWLFTEGALILLFIINSYVLIKKVSSLSARRSDVIDVEGQVVEEDKYKLK